VLLFKLDSVVSVLGTVPAEFWTCGCSLSYWVEVVVSAVSVRTQKDAEGVPVAGTAVC
jgi:hypothetical protein